MLPDGNEIYFISRFVGVNVHTPEKLNNPSSL